MAQKISAFAVDPYFGYILIGRVRNQIECIAGLQLCQVTIPAREDDTMNGRSELQRAPVGEGWSCLLYRKIGPSVQRFTVPQSLRMFSMDKGPALNNVRRAGQRKRESACMRYT